jgi:hypothetical protein
VTDDYDGVEVVDGAGEHIGKVERTFVDDSNAPRFVEVKFGTLLPKHRLIPTGEADLTDDGQLQVPYTKDVIEASPDAPKSDTLEPADLDDITAYYRRDDRNQNENEIRTESVAVPTYSEGQSVTTVPQRTPSHQFDIVDESGGALQVGDEVPAGLEAPIRETADMVEVPVLEEILVKKTVVREILRVRKSDIVEQETIEGDVRKEGIEIDDEAGAVVDTGFHPSAP